MNYKQHLNYTIIFCFLTITGCNFTPEYKRPELPVSAKWNIKQTHNKEKSVNNFTWEQFFLAPKLRNLIQKGLDNNRDLHQAALNIAVAKEQYQVAQSSILPTISASGTFSDQKFVPFTGGKSIQIKQYSANIGANSYEIDFFGRLRSLNEAALNNYLATKEATQTVHISLISQIAYGYMKLLTDKEQLELSQKTFLSSQKSYNLIKKRYDAGISTLLNLKQAETLLQTANVDIIIQQRTIQQDKNALELLIGAKLSEYELNDIFDTNIKYVADINAGLPSDLLLNRPDIRQAEYMLIAANADIGAARAAFFPSIALTTNTGVGSQKLSELFSSGLNTWLFSPQITIPIFTWGRNEANLNVAKLRKEISIANYEKVIQTAFREVSDALIARQTLERELSAQTKLVTAAKDYYKLATSRYKNGVDNYLTVLDASRNSYSAEQLLVTKHLMRISNFITLYSALGGGQNIRENYQIDSGQSPA